MHIVRSQALSVNVWLMHQSGYNQVPKRCGRSQSGLEDTNDPLLGAREQDFCPQHLPTIVKVIRPVDAVHQDLG